MRTSVPSKRQKVTSPLYRNFRSKRELTDEELEKAIIKFILTGKSDFDFSKISEEIDKRGWEIT